MALKKFTILKIFALLLFLFELFVPAFLSMQAASAKSEICKVASHNGLNNSIASFISEEAGSEEEREGRDCHKIDFESIIFDFSKNAEKALEVGIIDEITLSDQLSKDHTSLTILYSNFRL